VVKTIDYTDAARLEQLEQEELRIARTRKAIHQTYESEWLDKEGKNLPRHPTKKRHTLRGHRKWKNKKEQYRALEGNMTMRSFNNRNEQRRIVTKIFKNQKRLQDD
jgi:hypothetical protein